MAKPPSTASPASWNPAVPPPPVTGATVGNGVVTTGLGDGLAEGSGLGPVRPDLPELGQQHRPLRPRVLPDQRNATELDRPDRRPSPADPGHPAAVRPARRPHASHGERRDRGEPELPAERVPGPDLQPVGRGVRRLVLRPLGPAAVLSRPSRPPPPASACQAWLSTAIPWLQNALASHWNGQYYQSMLPVPAVIPLFHRQFRVSYLIQIPKAMHLKVDKCRAPQAPKAPGALAGIDVHTRTRGRAPSWVFACLSEGPA